MYRLLEHPLSSFDFQLSAHACNLLRINESHEVESILASLSALNDQLFQYRILRKRIISLKEMKIRNLKFQNEKLFWFSSRFQWPNIIKPILMLDLYYHDIRTYIILYLSEKNGFEVQMNSWCYWLNINNFQWWLQKKKCLYSNMCMCTVIAQRLLHVSDNGILNR